MSSLPHYVSLSGKTLFHKEYSISSIQLEDAQIIRKWRNEQMSALRQSSKLTEAEQAAYFHQIIEKDFKNSKPDKILVRFCFHEELIGYGGIVHLDWLNARGEVSFLLETKRTINHQAYSDDLKAFFELIKELGFMEVGLNKLSTEAYAHRAFHVKAIEDAGFHRDGVLREQVQVDGQWVDAVVASCLRNEYLSTRDS